MIDMLLFMSTITFLGNIFENTSVQLLHFSWKIIEKHKTFNFERNSVHNKI